MKYRFITAPLLLMALFLAVAPTAVASTTRYVNGVSGSDSNNCLSPTTACKTIGHAISLASTGDSVMVAAAIYKENLSIGISLKILGASASTTVIDGRGAGSVVAISMGTNVTLSGVTIRNGYAQYAGGISNRGTLMIIASTLSGNRVTTGKSGSTGGGGVYNYGTLTINNSTLTKNIANASCDIGCDAYGGGISNAISATLIINNSTLSGNVANAACRDPRFCSAYGGGILGGGTVTINNSTLSGNAANFRGGGGGMGSGGGTVRLQNSIVANSPSGGNCAGLITSHGYNLSSDNTCNFNATGDMNNTDPMLGPLQYNGGPTQTMALLPGSPAIDAGKPTGCTDGLGHLLKTDQRGDPRTNIEDTGGCDMGAYERQSD